MIQIHNPGAVVFVEAVLFAAMLLAVHRATAGRLWGWLGYGLATRRRFRLAAWTGLFLVLAWGLGPEWRDAHRIQMGPAMVRILAAALLLVLLAGVGLIHWRRRRQRVQQNLYRGLVVRLKTSGKSSAPSTIRAAIKALNRSGESAVDLCGCRLDGADLRGVRLYGADLTQASLQGADLRGVGFTGADLRGARLVGADLRQAFFYRTDLREADLSGADLRQADLREADLRGARLDGCRLADARLEEARLDGASLSGAQMENTQVCVAQLLKTGTLAHAILAPGLQARLVAARNPPLGLAHRLLRIDGSMPVWRRSPPPAR